MKHNKIENCFHQLKAQAPLRPSSYWRRKHFGLLVCCFFPIQLSIMEIPKQDCDSIISSTIWVSFTVININLIWGKETLLFNGTELLLGMMKTFGVLTVVLVLHHHECIECHWIVHLWMGKIINSMFCIFTTIKINLILIINIKSNYIWLSCASCLSFSS